MLYIKQKAFTLVELIVVVTILAILATIGFVSYSSYLTGVRDTNRIAQMTSLSDGLNLYSTTNDLPIPEDNVEVSVNTNLIAYQGYAGANILETINFEKGGVDPKDNTYFSYYLSRDRKYFQLMGFLEESADLTTQNIFSNQANAVNYQDRIPTVSGKKLGILTDLDNTPIQDLGTDLDVGTTTDTYKSYFKNGDVLEGNSSVLATLSPNSSCKRIKQINGGSKDGKYEINPSGVDGGEYEVYCDMTTDGGGWVLTTYIPDGYDPNFSGISAAYLAGKNFEDGGLFVGNEYLLDTNKSISEFIVDYQYGNLGDYAMNTKYMMKMTAPTSYLGLSLVTNTSGDTYADLVLGNHTAALVTGNIYESETIPSDIEIACNASIYNTVGEIYSNAFKMRYHSSSLRVFFGYSGCGSTTGTFSSRLDSNDIVRLFAKDADTDYEAKALRYWLR